MLLTEVVGVDWLLAEQGQLLVVDQTHGFLLGLLRVDFTIVVEEPTLHVRIFYIQKSSLEKYVVLFGILTLIHLAVANLTLIIVLVILLGIFAGCSVQVPVVRWTMLCLNLGVHHIFGIIAFLEGSGRNEPITFNILDVKLGQVELCYLKVNVNQLFFQHISQLRGGLGFHDGVKGGGFALLVMLYQLLYLYCLDVAGGLLNNFDVF